MSNEVKLEDAKPGMWAEFDAKNSWRFKDGHYLMELVGIPETEDYYPMISAVFMKMYDWDISKILCVQHAGRRSPIIDPDHNPTCDVLNLHVYAEKPEPAVPGTGTPEGFAETNTLKETPDYPHDLSGIPTEPGLYRAATGSVWYYDGKSWTPITDHKGKYTYADKQFYKQFIETSVKSHRIPFTSIRLPETDGDDTERVMPTEPGWYVDCEGDTYWFDGESYRSLLIEQGGVYTADEAADYAPYKPIADIEAWVKPWGKN